jgi:hypothetical protein
MFLPTPVGTIIHEMGGDPDDGEIVIESAGVDRVRLTLRRPGQAAALLIWTIDAASAHELGAELQRRSVLATIAAQLAAVDVVPA